MRINLKEQREKLAVFVETLPDNAVRYLIMRAEAGMDFTDCNDCLLGNCGDYDRMRQTEHGPAAETAYYFLGRSRWLPYWLPVSQARRDRELLKILRAEIAKRTLLERETITIRWRELKSPALEKTEVEEEVPCLN